jgi:hypothetical protein
MTVSAALVAFDERRANPTVNLGTLGSAGNVVWTGTRTLTPASVAYVYLPGVASNFLSVPDSPALRITGDVEFVARVSLTDWTPAAEQFVVGKFLVTGNQRSYVMSVAASGRIAVRTSPDGSAVVYSESSAVPAFADGVAYWIKATVDVDNGASGNTARFYFAADQATEPTAWTEIGSPVVNAGATSIFAGTAAAEVGSHSLGVSGPLAAGVRRAIIRDGIGGSTVLDVDTSVLTSMTATSFTATTGQTVTIGRSTGATYKTEVVLPGIPSRILNGTSDFGEVADLAGLDFGASDSFTVWALVQQWGTPNNNGVYVNKGVSTGARWSLGSNGTALGVLGFVNDGTNQAIDTSSTYAAGSLVLAAMRLNRSDATLAALRDGNLDSAATAAGSVGALSNAINLRVGVTGASATPQHFRLFAWGIHPYAMTSAQLTALRTALINGSNSGTGTRTVDLSIPTRTLELTA